MPAPPIDSSGSDLQPGSTDRPASASLVANQQQPQGVVLHAALIDAARALTDAIRGLMQTQVDSTATLRRVLDSSQTEKSLGGTDQPTAAEPPVLHGDVRGNSLDNAILPEVSDFPHRFSRTDHNATPPSVTAAAAARWPASTVDDDSPAAREAAAGDHPVAPPFAPRHDRAASGTTAPRDDRAGGEAQIPNARSADESRAAALAATVVTLQQQLARMTQLVSRGLQETLGTIAQLQQNQAAEMEQVAQILNQLAAIGSSVRARAQRGAYTA